MQTVVLASGSPRRAELMRAAGIPFIVDAAEVEEVPEPGEAAVQYALRAARDKAAAVAARRKSGSPVLGADTVVVVDGEIFGKPADDREAASMLNRLSGRTHDVVTGVSLLVDGRELAAVERTEVRFLPMGAEEIAWYIGSGEPRDKAGAYAIQGLASRFIERIDGSYSNVVGLPIATVYGLLRQAGVLK